jgi:phosphoglycolate phosphatase-like HAD superfamily hydrolase
MKGTERMEKPILVVDLDGTVINNTRRMVESARHLLGDQWPFSETPTSGEIVRYFEEPRSLDGVLKHGTERTGEPPIEQLYSVFLSSQFLQHDEPIQDAVSALQDISGSCRIVFLTARHEGGSSSESMKNGTLAWFHSHGFRAPEIIFKPSRDVCSTDELRRRDELFKRRELRRLKDEGRIVGVVGDTIGDIRSAVSEDLVPLWLCFDGRKMDKRILRSLESALHPPVVIESWEEVRRIVAFLSGNDTQIRPILDMYVTTYTAFLSTLDNITYLCLVTSTVALGFIFNAHQDHPLSLWLTSLNLSAVTLLFLSVASCVFAFLPKTSHPPRAGAPIIFLDIKRAWLRIRGILTDTQNVKRMDEGRGHDKRALFVKFVEDVYRTTDPTAILCQRCFDLRLANYAKIKWISWGAIFVLLGLSSMVLSLMSQIIIQFFATPRIGPV